jgi:hypothetical protein
MTGSKSGRITLVTGAAFLLACGSSLGPSDTAFEPDRVSFRVEGSAYTYLKPPDYISSGIVDRTLTISIDDYTKALSLALTVSNYAGPGTYAAGQGVEGNQGRFVLGGATYTTTPGVANGSVRVASESCNTTSGTDLATGIYATLTLCTLTGTFGFTATASGGAVVTVTDGAFRLTAQRRTV